MSDHEELARIHHLIEFGRHAEAEERARSLVADDPGWVPALLALSTALLHLDRHEESLEAARIALALAPESVGPKLAACDALVQLERGEEAVPLAEEAIAADPHDWTTYFAHARALTALRMPRVRDALESLDRALMLHPESADLHAYAGLLLEALGLRDRARVAFETALSIDPTNTVALTSMANLDAGLFRQSRSADNLRSALSVDAQDDYTHKGLQALIIRLVRGILLVLAGTGALLGIELAAGAGWGVRAVTGAAGLAFSAALVSHARQSLPRGVAGSPLALWQSAGVPARVLLVVSGVLALCVAMMAFAPVQAGAGAGMLFLHGLRGLLIAVVVIGVLRAISLLFLRR